MTLIEELEQAAHNFEAMAELSTIVCGRANAPAAELAARLRRRIELIQRMDRDLRGNSFAREVFDAVTGNWVQPPEVRP